MKKQIKKIATHLFANMKLNIERSTDYDSVFTLVRKLQPYTTDKNLIRLGPNGDGGYLIPDDFEGIEACFSPGVGKLSGFEEDCMARGMMTFLADKSVESPNINNSKFHFIKRFIGPITNESFITMDDWVNSSQVQSDSDLLLQMDIEGYEYLSLLNISDRLFNRFRIIVIEFHNLQKFWNQEFYKTASSVFNKILQNHICVHIHPNNCCGTNKRLGLEIPVAAEFTFIRKDRVSSKIQERNYPHAFDFDNTGNKHISLPSIWYSN